LSIASQTTLGFLFQPKGRKSKATLGSKRSSFGELALALFIISIYFMWMHLDNIGQDMSEFKSWSQSDKVKKPSQLGFDLKKWTSRWEMHGEGEEDSQLYNAAVFTDEALKKLRGDISRYFERHAPNKTSYSQVITLLVAYANRFFIFNQINQLSNYNNENFITGIQHNNVETNDEIAHSMVDSLQSAVEYCVFHIGNNLSLCAGKDPKNKDEFIEGLLKLSSAYSFCDGFFKAVLFETFTYHETENCCLFKENNSATNIANREAQYRKLKDIFCEIEENRGCVYSFPDIYTFKLKKEGRKKVFIKSIPEFNQKVHYYFYLFSLNRVFEQYDSKEVDAVFERRCFTKKELIETFSSIVVFSNVHINSKMVGFNLDINYSSSSFNREDFCRALSKVTLIGYDKISNIINFLTFNEGKGKDIWAFPLIKIDNSNISVILPASIAPTPQRVGEFWIKALSLNETSKGKYYETKVVETLKNHLNENRILFDKVKVFGPINIDCDGVKEEIDLLIILNDKILLIDIKCISSIDSPVSDWNSLKKIKHGVEQVIRKVDFVRDNINYISNHLQLDNDIEYEFYPYVLVSNLSFNGVQIKSVPVIDIDILIGYFSSGILNMLSLEGKSYAQLYLYQDACEAAHNFNDYFKKPFQTNMNFDLYEHKEVTYDFGLNKKIMVERLVRKDISLKETICKLKEINRFKITVNEEILKIIETEKINSL